MTSDERTKEDATQVEATAKDAAGELEKGAPSAGEPSSAAPASEAPRRRRIVRSAATSARIEPSEAPGEGVPPVPEGQAATPAEGRAQTPGQSAPTDAASSAAARKPAGVVHDYGRERHRAAPDASAPPARARSAPPNPLPSILDAVAPRQRRTSAAPSSSPGAGGWGERPPGPRRFHVEQSSALPGERPTRSGPPRDRFGGPGSGPRRERPFDRDRARDSAAPSRPRFDAPRGDRRRDARPASPAQPPEHAVAPPKPAAAPPPPPKPAPLPAGVPLPRIGQVAPKSVKPALTAKEALRAKTRAAQSATAKTDAAKPDAARAEAPKRESATFDERALAASWDEALELARSAGDAAAALVDAWASASNATAVAAIAESSDAPGPARKAARRALNVLKARGISIPERPRVTRLTEEAAAVLEATLIPSDSTGAQAITISAREPGGRYHIAEIILRDGMGILQAGTAWLSLSHLKEGRTRALENLGFGPIAVPIEWARWRIARALEQNTSTKRIVPLGFERCRELVEPAPAEEPTHPIADLESDIDSEKAWATAPGSGNLHDEPEFRSWLPDRGAMEELLRKVGERLGPEGAKESDRVGEALREEISAATDRFFSPEVRTTIAGRMRDSAISIRARRGDARASEALAVARAVREAGLITSPPRDIPFLKAFFDKAIGYLAQQSGGSLRIPMAQQASPV